jgi:hypothetical protein
MYWRKVRLFINGRKNEISANIDSHPTEESMVEQVVGEVIFSTSSMLITCHAVNITSHFVASS